MLNSPSAAEKQLDLEHQLEFIKSGGHLWRAVRGHVLKCCSFKSERNGLRRYIGCNSPFNGLFNSTT